MTNNDEGMSLVEHLGELRKRIIWVLLVLIGGMVIGIIVAQPLILYLKNVPPASGIAWNAFSPWDSIKLYMNFALITGLIVTLPFALYQIWSFLKPGLRVEEQKASLIFIPLAFLLFLIGLAFAYFVVFKMAFIFTSEISERLDIKETYGITQYFTFMFNILLPIGLIFELPIIIMFLTKLRILNPKRLHKLRRYAYMILVIVAAMITPPDLISAVVVSLPMILLYEVSVWLSGSIYRKQLIKDQEWEEEFGPK
ncbi:twin-arginine translocase subunit TatC [Paenibacillus sp. WQ 127069]|uniref:Sec-independent protein translocase protein TatC n=1 Tax=Paenibacillus baimaensis TaxID=2982185 RepID=A0ABT2UIH9_9BACL|nr:twin-arginine translocase subunit TatC [Paenibacillus sp. WQ 127069]MCU6793464.1 twin-arginine translocase subunit TatC [Paenibacillus sp. WQ 127069]